MNTTTTKPLVFKIPEDVKDQPIDTMKVAPDVLEYLHNYGCVTIRDFIAHQEDVEPRIKGRVIAWLGLGLTI